MSQNGRNLSSGLLYLESIFFSWFKWCDQLSKIEEPRHMNVRPMWILTDENHHSITSVFKHVTVHRNLPSTWKIRISIQLFFNFFLTKCRCARKLSIIHPLFLESTLIYQIEPSLKKWSIVAIGFSSERKVCVEENTKEMELRCFCWGPQKYRNIRVRKMKKTRSFYSWRHREEFSFVRSKS